MSNGKELWIARRKHQHLQPAVKYHNWVGYHSEREREGERDGERERERARESERERERERGREGEREGREYAVLYEKGG